MTIFVTVKIKTNLIILQNKVGLRVNENEDIDMVAKEFADQISKENYNIPVEYEIFYK